MRELEAGALVAEYVALVHAFGEAIWSRVDFWVGASFAIILLGYFAPERLRPGVTTLILGLYICFSATIYFNMARDLEMAAALAADARELAMTHGLDFRIFARDSQRADISWTLPLFLLGLFIGTSGFLLIVCITNYRNREGGIKNDA